MIPPLVTRKLAEAAGRCAAVAEALAQANDPHIDHLEHEFRTAKLALIDECRKEILRRPAAAENPVLRRALAFGPEFLTAELEVELEGEAGFMASALYQSALRGPGPWLTDGAAS